MRSGIELLCASRDFATIVRRWSDAVQTPQGIVIPRFHQVGPTTSITAEIHPGTRVILRPAVGGRAHFSSARQRVLSAIASALDIPLQREPVDTSLGSVALDDEEWGDFSVVIRPPPSHMRSVDNR